MPLINALTASVIPTLSATLSAVPNAFVAIAAAFSAFTKLFIDLPKTVIDFPDLLASSAIVPNIAIITTIVLKLL